MVNRRFYISEKDASLIADVLNEAIMGLTGDVVYLHRQMRAAEGTSDFVNHSLEVTRIEDEIRRLDKFARRLGYAF